MKQLQPLFLLVYVLILASCNSKQTTSDNSDTSTYAESNTGKDINFDEILKCSAYSYNEGYFLTPDYGCIYNPGKGNDFGNIIVYLIPKKQLTITDDQIDTETKRINTLNRGKYKEDFAIYVYLIDKKYLNYNKTGDPVYYQKDNFIEKVYTYNAKIKKWDLVDSINVTAPNTEQIWRNSLINKLVNRPNTKPAETTVSSPVSNTWYGIYSFTLNDNNTDWRETQDISLTITKDAIIYHAQGYQIDQTYRLSGLENNNSLNLHYQSAVDNIESAVLKKTKDFGTVTHDGNSYHWVCPYIDISFRDGKSTSYLLNKAHE